MEVETVQGEIVIAVAKFFEDKQERPEPFIPDPLIATFIEALKELRGETNNYRDCVVLFECDDDDKGGEIKIFTTPMTKDRLITLIGKAGLKARSAEPKEEKLKHPCSPYVPEKRVPREAIKCGLECDEVAVRGEE